MVYRLWTMDPKSQKKTPDVIIHRAFAIKNLVNYLAATTRTFTLNSSAMALSPRPSKKLLEP